MDGNHACYKRGIFIQHATLSLSHLAPTWSGDSPCAGSLPWTRSCESRDVTWYMSGCVVLSTYSGLRVPRRLQRLKPTCVWQKLSMVFSPSENLREAIRDYFLGFFGISSPLLFFPTTITRLVLHEKLKIDEDAWGVCVCAQNIIFLVLWKY